MQFQTIEWSAGRIRILDQTRLPEETIYLEIGDVEDLAEAIRNLRIRGAPAIGVASAFGAVLAAQRSSATESLVLIKEVREAIVLLSATRPTAVNLFWALKRMEKVLDSSIDAPVVQIRERLLLEASTILEEDRSVCKKIGQNGAVLLPEQSTILTHCNAGALATAGQGTALSVLYEAVEMGKKIKIYADETRPLLQGARLTAWELKQAGLDVTVTCDSAAGMLMNMKRIDCVLVGADRIAANGDAANKIGTYGLAVLAKHHRIPFYIAAPVSTFDLSIGSGSKIPIEERLREEISFGFGKRTVPADVQVFNPAFDVTPHSLITAFITERGVFYPPFKTTFKRLGLH